MLVDFVGELGAAIETGCIGLVGDCLTTGTGPNLMLRNGGIGGFIGCIGDCLTIGVGTGFNGFVGRDRVSISTDKKKNKIQMIEFFNDFLLFLALISHLLMILVMVWRPLPF